ncbi:hypothetical protein RND81_08G201500 [Saponaria officinalis]|uniref:BURP domain-containing protein n=1 Tax=Saponaria officinalis TaxID=3572 RepID=A0AAW1JC71_SAPOF
MGRHLLILLFLCIIALKGNHASVSPVEYWKNKLPTTSMPQSITDSLLPSGKVTTTNSQVNTNGHDEVLPKNPLHSTGDCHHLPSHSAKGGSLVGGPGYDDSLSYVNIKNSPVDGPGYDGSLSYAKNSIKNSPVDGPYDGLLSYTKDSIKNSLASAPGYIGLLSYKEPNAKDSIHSTNNDEDRLLSFSVKDSLDSAPGYDELLSYSINAAKKSPSSSNSNNNYGDVLSYVKTSRKLLEDPNGYDGSLSYAGNISPRSMDTIMKDQTFFVEEDLHHGKKMTLVFQKGNKKNILFLPRQVSNKIPFSSNKLPEIYNIFSMDPESQEAHMLASRIELCEEPRVKNVEKKCVTSLESMVDFVVSEIGNNVKAMTTNLEQDYPKMEYTIHRVTELSKNDHETVVCHKLGYPYAVFYCHSTTTIRSYKVDLVGNDGTVIEAIADCHKEMNPILEEYVVDVLKVVPGSTRICHFPGAEDNIIWVVE